MGRATAMVDATAAAGPGIRRRIFGWMMFDWASQPFATLLTTFVFAPYFASVLVDQLVAEGVDAGTAGARAQAAWGDGLAIAGVLIAVLAPVFGSIADNRDHRRPWIVFFSVLYVAGSAALWWTVPGAVNVPTTLAFYVVGLVGMEFATIFTNAQLPSLGSGRALGAISGFGWALGYLSGVVALILTLVFVLAGEGGTTLAGLTPAFGLEYETREDARAVGPLTAAWFVVFMIPYFAWVRDPRPQRRRPAPGVWEGLVELWRSLRALPENRSLFAYLGASMFYRDALNGMYTFGGIYALGVLGWSVTQVGVFGIIAALTGAVFAALGGLYDAAAGPKPVIVTSIVVLLAVTGVIVGIDAERVLWIDASPGTEAAALRVAAGPIVIAEGLPSLAFMICGMVIGAAGGMLQASSRTMMVCQAHPDRMTEGFGFYALAGKATSFLAPFLIARVSAATDSQRLGISPLIGLFAIGLILLIWVKPLGEKTVR